jgi:hypothetical protein
MHEAVNGVHRKYRRELVLYRPQTELLPTRKR